MNREEAIYYLESSGFNEEQINTIEQALKKEPYGKLVLSHSEISGQIYAYIGNEKHNITKEAIEAVQAVKALEQQPYEDAISRAEVLDLIDSKDPNYEVRHFKEDVECLDPIYTCTEDIPCTECPQYDKEKNYCPHFCHVIRDVFEEKTGHLVHGAKITLEEVIETLQTWIATADDEYDREEHGRVCGLKEALHLIKKVGEQEE